MQLLDTPISGLFGMETTALSDTRGQFTRVFCTDAFSAIRPDVRFVQVNHSVTARHGTIRGLHYQRAPHADAKLIRCIRGAVFDVAVDLRVGSPTYGTWHAFVLSEENGRQVFIPEGFAHGFQSLTDDAHLLYQHTAPHTAGAEGGVRFDDAALSIWWPLPVSLISERDRNLPPLAALTERIAA